MPSKSRDVHTVPQIFHRESFVRVRYDCLNEYELFKVCVGRRVRFGNLPLFPINTRRDLGFETPKTLMLGSDIASILDGFRRPTTQWLDGLGCKIYKFYYCPRS